MTTAKQGKAYKRTTVIIIAVFTSLWLIGIANYTIRRATAPKTLHPLGDIIRTVNVNGNNIAFAAKGESDPIIMIHGSQMNAYDWRYNIGHFAESHRVYALDMIGNGWSDKPRGDYSPDFFAGFIKNFMNALEIENAIFFASSWGGGHTLHFALKHPERVNALVLSSPCGFKHRLDIMYLLRVPVLGRLILLNINRAIVRSQLRAAYYDTSLVTPELVNAVYRPFLKPGFIRAALRAYRNSHFDFVERNIYQITAPTLLIWGANDHKHPIEMAKRMNREIKGSQLVIFENCGHLPHSEKHERFNYHAQIFLEELIKEYKPLERAKKNDKNDK